jgi:hypothetical protein
MTAPPPDTADVIYVIYVTETVLADAVEKKVVNLLHISMRLRIELRAVGVDGDLGFGVRSPSGSSATGLVGPAAASCIRCLAAAGDLRSHNASSNAGPSPSA